jgi:hypothetical protein
MQPCLAPAAGHRSSRLALLPAAHRPTCVSQQPVVHASPHRLFNLQVKVRLLTAELLTRPQSSTIVRPAHIGSPQAGALHPARVPCQCQIGSHTQRPDQWTLQWQACPPQSAAVTLHTCDDRSQFSAQTKAMHVISIDSACSGGFQISVTLTWIDPKRHPGSSRRPPSRVACCSIAATCRGRDTVGVPLRSICAQLHLQHARCTKAPRHRI